MQTCGCCLDGLDSRVVHRITGHLSSCVWNLRFYPDDAWVVVPADQVETALDILTANGEDAYVIGEIIKGDDGVVLG